MMKIEKAISLHLPLFHGKVSQADQSCLLFHRVSRWLAQKNLLTLLLFADNYPIYYRLFPRKRLRELHAPGQTSSDSPRKNRPGRDVTFGKIRPQLPLSGVRSVQAQAFREQSFG